jgi:hypothetical protein
MDAIFFNDPSGFVEADCQIIIFHFGNVKFEVTIEYSDFQLVLKQSIHVDRNLRPSVNTAYQVGT